LAYAIERSALNPTPGNIIANRFQLVRELGRGSMGTVWLANHLTLDVQCAVKFMTFEPGQEALYAARFAQEARAIAQVQSPYIVRVLDYDLWNGLPYIAMEYLVGEDLGARLRRQKRLDFAATYRIVDHVARGLSRAHAAGIVHRDLKPENIFLAREGDEEIAKLVDFGIVKIEGRAGRRTQVGEVLGTPMYMSPEQARSAQTIDHRADLWSLGVIAYECLVGRPAFDGVSLAEIFARIMWEPIPVPSQVAPELPPAFDRWWARAVSRDPEGRFADAREMADALGLTEAGAVHAPHLELVDDPEGAPEGPPSRPVFPTDPSAVLAARLELVAEGEYRPPATRSWGKRLLLLGFAVGLVAVAVPFGRLATRFEGDDLQSRIRGAASALTAPLPPFADAPPTPSAALVPPTDMAPAPSAALAPLPTPEPERTPAPAPASAEPDAPASVLASAQAPASSARASAPALASAAALASALTTTTSSSASHPRTPARSDRGHAQAPLAAPVAAPEAPAPAEAQSGECIAGQRRCNGTILQQCNAALDGWTDSVDCGESAVCDATSAGPCHPLASPPSEPPSDNPYQIP
jgi:serine/threonine-protein kinase